MWHLEDLVDGNIGWILVAAGLRRNILAVTSTVVIDPHWYQCGKARSRSKHQGGALGLYSHSGRTLMVQVIPGHM
jgi:hypothetical protein